MSSPPSTVQLQVQTDGSVPQVEAEYARAKIQAALGSAHEPVLHARARLALLPDPAATRPAIAQVNIDLNGRLIRTQTARATMREAVDELHDRLRDRLHRAARDWEAIRGRRPAAGPHEWGHASAPTQLLPHFPRPAQDRRIVRHKAYGLATMTVDEAAFDMSMLDYRFHLFTEQGSGIDSVLYLPADRPGHRLGQLSPHPDRVTGGATEFTVSPHEAPTLDVHGAIERLDLTGWPFVFFRDAATGRGCIVYTRYDGHYGLIEPAS